MNKDLIRLEASREAGNAAAAACENKARKLDPSFTEKAEAAILAHLQKVGPASGEVLTDVAIANGARHHDARAFGSVFQRLSQRGLIRTVGYCLRSKGHGTAGGRVWGLAA